MMHIRRLFPLIPAAALILTVNGAAQAATVAYDIPASTAGTQSFGGVLGMDFVVNSDIRVTSLGAFDHNSDGIASGTITTELWGRNENGTPTNFADDSGAGILASDTFTSGSPGTLIGGSRFKTLGSPLLLTPGAYTIVAYGYSASERNGNLGTGSTAGTVNVGGGLISPVGVSRNGGTAGSSIGTGLDAGPANRYHAGTFQYETVYGTTSISINNPSFENDTIPNSPGHIDTTDQWTDFDGAAVNNGVLTARAGSDLAGKLAATPDLADNDQNYWSNSTDLYQALSSTLQANTTYTLVADLGDRNDAAFPSAELRLGYGATPGVNLLTAGSVVNPTPPNGGWALWRSTFTTGVAPAGLGQPLRVELIGGGTQPQFDNVRLLAGRPPQVDTTTQGDWVGTYGTEGYILANFNGGSDLASLPGYINSHSWSGESRAVWNGGTAEARAVESPDESVRKATTVYASGTYSLTLDVNQEKDFRMGLYFLDWDSSVRALDVSVAGSAIPLAESVSDFNQGKWLVFDVSAGTAEDVVVTFTRTAGANAVVSAITFDPIPEPGALLLAVMGLVGLAAFGRRRRLQFKN